MRRIRKILGIVMVFIMAFSILPISAISAAMVDNSAYDATELGKLQTFLNLDSGNAGKTNGQSLNVANIADPSTWTGVIWTNTEPKKVIAISDDGTWNDKGLAGSLNLSGFTKLEFCDLTDNLLTSIDVSGDTNLKSLYCDNNKLSSLDLSTNTGLTILDCSYNDYLTKLDVKNNTKLERLNCSHCPIYFLYFGESEKLNRLDCSYCNLSEIDLSGVQYVGYLDCTNNYLKDITYTSHYFYNSVDITTEGGGYVGLRSAYGEDREPRYLVAVAQGTGIAKFVHWEFESEGINYDDEPDFPLGVERDYYLTAVFEKVDISGTPPPPSPTPTIEPSLPTYLAIFNANGGERTGGGDMTQSVQSGKNAVPPTVVREGYNFKGWDGTYENMMHDNTIIAQWEKIAVAQAPIPTKFVQKFTLTYDLNGGTGTATDSEEYQEGDIVSLVDGSDLIKDGYVFVGWSEEPDGDVITEYEITIESDTTLYAVWEAVSVPEPTQTPAPTETPKAQETADIPKTGETSGVLYGALMLLFGSGIVTVETIRRRRQRRLES